MNQKRPTLLDIMRDIGVLSETANAQIAAILSETSANQLRRELLKAIEQRLKIAVAAGKLLMPSKANKNSTVGTPDSTKFLILEDGIPTGTAIVFPKKSSPFNDFVVAKKRSCSLYRQFCAIETVSDYST